MQRLPIGLLGAVESSQIVVNIPQLDPGVGVVALDGQGLLELGNGLLPERLLI
jgi:hypothetical protein